MTVSKQEVRKALRARKDEVVEVLCDLIRFPSTRGKEGPVGRYLLDRMSDLVDVCEPAPIAENLVEDPDYSFPLEGLTYEERPNVRLVKKGAGRGKSLLFNTHMDVVPPSQMQERPFDPQVRDGIVLGRGACDAKGQIATLFLALRVLDDLGIALKGDVIAHLVVEEECGGNGTLACIRGPDRADAAIVLEPTGLTCLPSVRGAVWFEVTCTGRSGHSGQAKATVSALKEAISAIRILEGYHARLLSASKGIPLFDAFENPMPITFGTMEAGDWPATAPQKATFKGVLGFLPNKTKERIQEEMRRVLIDEGDDWLKEHFDLNFIYRHDSSVIPTDHPLVQTMAQACRGSDLNPEITAMPASCDAWFYNNLLDIPTLVFGPGKLQTAHSNHEQIAVAEILKAAETLIELMRKWSG
ncbi:MAG: M20/M25/M40 family metallo-hydrolase [Candidatus Latescibacteria bacterium]|nr:M20/M25/M40 family metallo-hydrolase [Candidatus Latescibacterota bacterium]